MTRPRPVVAGRFYLITRRTAQQQFLMHPDDVVCNAFTYCLGVAAPRYDIDILGPCAMSNHHHTVIYDRDGNYPQFIEYFHRMLARCLNRRYERRDNFWSAEQCSVVQLMDVDAILEKLTYTFTNPVKHGAAYTIDRWPGVNGYANLLTGTPLRATRPVFFFRAEDTDLPETVELQLVLPDVLGDKAIFLQRLKARVEARVMQLQAERALKGLSFVGRAALKRLTWEYKPPIKKEWVSGSMKSLRNRIKPHFASKDVDNRIEAIQERRAFHAAYRKAREAWLKGEMTCAFPIGTYWLRRNSCAPVEQPATTTVFLH